GSRPRPGTSEGDEPAARSAARPDRTAGDEPPREHRPRRDRPSPPSDGDDDPDRTPPPFTF
ncbi:MAG TPA: hypothetical protein RMH99_03480, partial [Sandaracinaceae bacterium LLY-WYZ-13_1]|nr:hypothetical protein [Sandaracinaceae bacterium LLY-WYZ-13_1]